MIERVDFWGRRSNFAFLFQNVRVEFNLLLRFSGNSDGSGGLGKVF